MSYNKFLILGAGVLLSAIASSNVSAATNCSISYYCYRSMTPGPAPAGNDVLVRRTTAANNRVTAAARRAQPQRPGIARAPQQRVQLTPQQRQAEARRREQVQQRELAQRRQRAAQQTQQRLAQQRQRAQQLAQRRQQNGQRPPAQRPAQPAAANRAQPNANATRQQQLIAAQRRAHQVEQQRLAQQRLVQQRRAQAAAAARTQPVANRATPTPRPSVLTSATQTCPVISKKITELSRQAVLRSKEKKYDQAQRLFKAVEQLKTEGKKNSCAGIV